MIQDLLSLTSSYLVSFGWKLIGAIVIWFVGGWVISILSGLFGKMLTVRKLDVTLSRYLEGGVNGVMRLLLLISILGVLGIETTSFAALLAAAGVAIGAAWAGLLANFAAGVFLMVLRPFKVGDMITAGGITGDVKEIGLFVTAIDTLDNVRVYLGNNKIFSDSIQNYTTNPYRRVELTAQVSHQVNPYDAIKRLQARVAQIPNITSNPAPSVEILQFNQWGAVIAVRPFCHNKDYWQVYFDTNKAIVDVGAEAGYTVPEQRIAIRNLP